MGKLRYRVKPNTGKHTYFDDDGSRVTVKPGEIVSLKPEVARPFLYKLDLLDPMPSPQMPSIGLRLERTPGGERNQWDVVNEATGKAINDEPLTANDARSLMAAKKKELEEEVGDVG